jgi:Cu/Ag efflux pump CusA
MLATGIKSPVGIKVAGTDLKEIDRLATRIEEAVKTVPGVTSALAERLTGGRYIDVDIDRAAAGRYGLNIEDVQSIVSSAIGVKPLVRWSMDSHDSPSTFGIRATIGTPSMHCGACQL